MFHHILEKSLNIHRWFEVDPHHRLGCEAVVVQTVQTVAVGILQCAFVKDQETTTSNAVDGSEVRRSPVEVGTLAHYVQKIYTPGISEPSTMGMHLDPERGINQWNF